MDNVIYVCLLLLCAVCFFMERRLFKLEREQPREIEIEDDGETAVLYLKAPEHKGVILTVLISDGDELGVYRKKEEI